MEGRARRSLASPPAIYPIADYEALGGRVPQAVRELVAAGARWIQVRAKRLADRRLYSLLAATSEAVAGREVTIWINDRPDLAALLPVGGVQLGQDDLPPRAARRVVGPGVWIGRSTHDESQFKSAAADVDVDVVALGPVFATSTKPDAEPVVGLELLARARRWTGKPLVAIGGIDETNVERVLAAGADCAAVIGAVCRPPVGERFEALTRAAEGRG